jgi:protein-tyrosine phosphatase
MSNLSFSLSPNGSLVLKGDLINEIAFKWIKLFSMGGNVDSFGNAPTNHEEMRMHEYHIPILLPDEIIPLLSNPLEGTSLPIDEWNQQYLSNLKIHDVGIGRSSAISDLPYVIVYSSRLQKFRSQYHLSPLDLYIPIPSHLLSFLKDSESHNNSGGPLRRDIHTLFYHHSFSSYHQTLQKILSSPANSTVRSYLSYDHLIQQLRSSGQLSGLYFHGKELMKSNSLHSMENLQIIYNLFEETIQCPNSCLKTPADNDNYGELVAQILNSNLKYSALGSHKLRRFYQSTVAPASASIGDSQSPEYYSLSFTNFPRNFSMVCDSLYGSSLPTTTAQLSCWKAMGITNIITVMEEPLPEELRQSSDLNFHHFVVPDRLPPSLEQIHSILVLLGQLLHPSHSNPSKRQVVIHCLGGVGRTATVLCCYLMRFQQMSRETAQNLLISTRKTILTSPQEEFLQKYYQHCLVTSASDLSNSSLTHSTTPLLHPTTTLPSLIVCIGYPGAGKSTFCEALVKAFPHLVTRINEKEDMRGIKDQKHVEQLPRVMILDRCNLRQEERLEWLSSLRGDSDAMVWYVHFELSEEECQWRLVKQANQSAPKSGKTSSSSGQRRLGALKQSEASLEDPVQDMERYQKIFKISSAEEANHLLSEWGVPSTLLPSLSLAPGVAGEGAEVEGAGVPTKMIIKFPRTRHVYNLGSATRDDLILSSDDAFKQFLDPSKLLYIEEKIDGANLGISIQHFPPSPPQLVVQNRSHFVSSGYHPQFKCLDQWLAQHSNELWEILQYSDRFILYGEWVYARHSIAYTHLPDYFLAFDYFDKLTQRFYSRDRLASLLKNTSIHQIHLLSCSRPSSVSAFTSSPSSSSVSATSGSSSSASSASGTFSSSSATSLSKEQLVEIVRHQRSKYYDGCVEGVYLRTMTPDNLWLLDRGKIVRGDFIAGNEFWSKGGVHQNQLDHQLQAFSK